MKFKLATTLWLITTVCLIVGWLWERRSYNHMIHQQLDAEVRVECAIKSALCRTIFSANFHDLENGATTKEEFNSFKQRQLIESLIELFQNETAARKGVLPLSNGTFRAAQTDRVLESAGMTLSLLKFSSAEDLNNYFIGNKKYVDYFGRELFEEDGTINDQFRDFIKRAIEYHIAASTGTK